MNLKAVLTDRQKQIAQLLAWGATKKETAARLFISERTVENHCRVIYQKTEVDTVNGLSAWWFCKEFNISLDLSPRTRSVLSAIMLLIYSSTFFTDQGMYLRRYSRRIRIEFRIKE